jgi:hypothetical protein
MKNTTVELVSFINGLSNKKRLDIVAEAINYSISDLILFPGHSILSYKDLEVLRKSICKSKTEAIIEIKDIGSDKIGNCLYRISNGELLSLNTNQLFSTSDEIENNIELAERLLSEFEFNRQFKINGKQVLVIQCGELNILKNIQSENNSVEFRLSSDVKLKKKFNEILKSTDIVLNPIHSPMGNQGKMEKRRLFLSKNKKYYFSTSNTKVDAENLNLPSLQYAFYNKKPMESILINTKAYYINRVFEVI